MKVISLIKVIALVEFVAALMWPGVYLFSQHALTSNSIDTFTIAFSISGALFILAPTVSLVGAFFDRRWVYFSLLIFPVLAFVHGISAVPYLSHLAPTGVWRTGALAIINGGVIFLVLWLRRRSLPRHA